VTRAVEIPAGQVVTVLVDLFAQRGGKDVKP
jgi:hypothetical protein